MIGRALLAMALVCLVVLLAVAGFLTYRITAARTLTENVTPASYLLSNYREQNFTDRAGGEHEGWLLLGLKRAPVIILCPGYNSNRSELLSLGTMLRENHFNVYLFNFHGPKVKKKYRDLGGEKVEDILAAIETLTRQPEVNPNRVGLFGTTTSAYAALIAASESKQVRAAVLDSVYDHPDQFLVAQVDRLVGGSTAWFRRVALAEFHLLCWGKSSPLARERLAKMEGIPKLFVSSVDLPDLEKATLELYTLAPQPKRLFKQEHSQAALASTAEKKEFESQVISFFLENLPLRGD